MSQSLKILHCLRAPVGGLFRHVCDLAAEQARMGHKIGVVCDSQTGGAAAEKALSKLGLLCELGVARVAMARSVGFRDYLAYRGVCALVRSLGGVDIIHGHGAKGGAYARLAGRALKRQGTDLRTFYTPHGGSLHYPPESLKGRIYLRLERWLEPMSDGLIFESAYSQSLYGAKIGSPTCPSRVIPNGLRQSDFYDIILADEAADFLFIGELRHLKGVDVLLEAVAQVARSYPIKTVIIGSGPDERAFKDLAKSLDIEGCVSFPGYVPADLGFVRGRCLVVPSRAESFPYIVLEAAALKKPTILTNVGGIPEMTNGLGITLLPPGDADALAEAMKNFLDDPIPLIEEAEKFSNSVANQYTVEKMAHDVTGFYEDLMAA